MPSPARTQHGSTTEAAGDLSHSIRPFRPRSSLGISVIMVENSILNGIEDPGPGHSGLNVFPNPFTQQHLIQHFRNKRDIIVTDNV